MTALQAVFDLLLGSPGLVVLTAFGLAGIAALLALWLLGQLAGQARVNASPIPCASRRRVPFIRLRDPDNAGRPRPRAPSPSPALPIP